MPKEGLTELKEATRLLNKAVQDLEKEDVDTTTRSKRRLKPEDFDMFLEVLRFIFRACPTRYMDRLTVLKLHKILWFVDCYHYRKHGETLSKGIYESAYHGPISSNLEEGLKRLRDNREIWVNDNTSTNVPFFVIQQSFFNFRSILLHDQKLLIEKVVLILLENYRDEDICEMSRDSIWRAVEIGEEIPPEAILAAKAGVLTKEDIAWAEATILKNRKASLGKDDWEDLKEVMHSPHKPGIKMCIDYISVSNLEHILWLAGKELSGESLQDIKKVFRWFQDHWRINFAQAEGLHLTIDLQSVMKRIDRYLQQLIGVQEISLCREIKTGEGYDVSSVFKPGRVLGYEIAEGIHEPLKYVKGL